MKIQKCRNCKSRNIRQLFSLGKMSFTGKFGILKQQIPKDYINLVICNKCQLVQLDRNFNPKYLYANDYGYRTGINQTMTNHVKNVVALLKKKAHLQKGDLVLDIASNDGTLLNFYGNKYITVGIDPLITKFKKNYRTINYKVSNFFDLNYIHKLNLKKKFKTISALSVFYDLKNPNIFLRDIKDILHPDGIFLLEFADLSLIIKNFMFDTICHEHLEYYSTSIICEMAKQNGLKVFDHMYNDINGGSSRFFISHADSKFKVSHKKIRKIIKNEKKLGIMKVKKYRSFFKKINQSKKKLINLLENLKKKGCTIHGYGASTKGNVLLQFYKINNRFLDYICERNPQKYNLYTPGSSIKIISEKKSRMLKPDYYLVLPWHFKNEILKRESQIRKKGTKFIFPLPKLEII